MKLIEEMVITELADDFIAVPTGDAAEKFHGVIRLNSTGADIVRGLQEGLSVDEIAEKLVADYDGVDLDTARKCTLEMIEKLRDAGVVTD